MPGTKLTNYTVIILILAAITLSSDFIFFSQQKQKILSLNQTLTETKEQTQAELQLMKNLIQGIETDYQTKLSSITKSLERIQKESSTKLSELEEELKGVSITAGDFSLIIEDAIKGVISVATDKGLGSGAVVTEDGYIVTNYHVVRSARVINAVDYNKNIYIAQLVGANEQKDIAVLKIDGQNFHDLNFADSSKVKVGEKVVALGNPAGLGFSATEGIISQVDRVISPNLPPLIQTDAQINPGNSGGPLINNRGSIIGINELKIAGYEGLGFAIPSNVVKPVVEEIIGRDI